MFYIIVQPSCAVWLLLLAVVVLLLQGYRLNSDLCMTFAPVGHHAPLRPLVTGPHLHPSPASSPPSSSSPSTLPSTSQSSLSGPPRSLPSIHSPFSDCILSPNSVSSSHFIYFLQFLLAVSAVQCGTTVKKSLP